MSNRETLKALERGLSDRAKPGFGTGSCLPRVPLQRPPVAVQPGSSLPPPCTQLRLHLFSSATPVVVSEAIFAADGSPEIEDLVFVQFGAAVGTEEKEALVFHLHDVTCMMSLADRSIISPRSGNGKRKFQRHLITGSNDSGNILRFRRPAS